MYFSLRWGQDKTKYNKSGNGINTVAAIGSIRAGKNLFWICSFKCISEVSLYIIYYTLIDWESHLIPDLNNQNFFNSHLEFVNGLTVNNTVLRKLSGY